MPSFRATELPLPRFVSLKSDKVYARTGPAVRYPIRWVYNRARLPVEIVQEFDTWRKIRDVDGGEGWVHKSLLASERTVLVRSDEPLVMRREASADGRMMARLEPGVVAGVETCDDSNVWCRLDAGGYKGWVERNSLWGIYENEELN